MRVKLLARMAGPDGNFSVGAERDLPEKQARELVTGGYAVSLEAVTRRTADRKPEQKAVVEPERTADLLSEAAGEE